MKVKIGKFSINKKVNKSIDSIEVFEKCSILLKQNGIIFIFLMTFWHFKSSILFSKSLLQSSK